MEQSGGGQITAKLAKPADGSEDRLSALPDELLVLILECLDTTAEAARTSVLARRWGGLLPVLSKLRFQLRPDDDGNRIRELLGVTDAPKIRYISVTTRGATADSAMAWLPAAAGRLFGGLVYHNMVPDMKNHDAVEMARRGGTVQLPCFENATSIELRLQFLGLALPSLGVFTRLTDLCLRCLKFPGPCELGDLLSSPRCPCLQKLSISFSELGNLSINSESLLQMNLMFCDLRQLTIVTPLLQKLSVHGCFVPAIAGDDQSEQQGANITAPLMVSLVWMDQYDPRYFHLGQPQQLQTGFFYLYGPQTDRERNHSCLNLLQQFKVLDSLHLQLVYFYYKQDICHYQYLLGDMTALPRIMFLHLDLYNRGHSFGASLFHVLRMCTGLQRLSLVLHGRQHRSNLEVEPAACPSGCVCDQPNNWKTDELVLDHLEDAHIIGLRGAEHEVALVQRFLGWATVLKSLRITLVNEMTEAEIGEFRQALEGSFRSETWVQFDTSDSKRSEHSIVPKDQSLPCRCDSEALVGVGYLFLHGSISGSDYNP